MTGPESRARHHRSMWALMAIALLVSACDLEPPTYADCRAARDAGVAPIREGDPAYRRDMDRDRDGVACDD